jgi:hypothetical protein
VSDITLPRAEAEQIRQALASGKRLYAALTALDAALAEPEPTVKDSLTVDHIRSIWLDSWKACGNVPTPVLAEHFARQIERAHGIGLAKPTGKDSLQVDAERYRWLRGELHGSRPPLARVVWKRHNIRESGDWTNLSDGQTLDEAIDAALSEPEQAPDALRRWANANDDAPETEFQRGYDAARRWVREVGLPALAEPEHIHTCGPDCQKPPCVNRRREIAAAVEAEREAICPIVYGLCVLGINAQEIVNAIRARGSK